MRGLLIGLRPRSNAVSPSARPTPRCREEPPCVGLDRAVHLAVRGSTRALVMGLCLLERKRKGPRLVISSICFARLSPRGALEGTTSVHADDARFGGSISVRGSIFLSARKAANDRASGAPSRAARRVFTRPRCSSRSSRRRAREGSTLPRPGCAFHRDAALSSSTARTSGVRTARRARRVSLGEDEASLC